MPKSEINSKEGCMDEKEPKAQDNQPPAKGGPAQENVPHATSEGHKILGTTRENSGWDVYNNEAREFDTQLVKEWTTSMNFQLVFSAIIAAVLIPCIIESRKLLEPDPMVTMVDVMIFYTNNVANGDPIPYNRTDFEASTNAVLINMLFFGSLCAILLAALASMVALDWVASYDTPIARSGSPPEDRAKRRQSRYAAVVQLRMSEFIALVPVLPFLSVGLFLIGMIAWTVDSNLTVGVFVTMGTWIAILFYFISSLIMDNYLPPPHRTWAPFRRFDLIQLLISALYWLMRAMHISPIPDWIKTRHSMAAISYRREERVVENTATLGRDALVWLANQISISQYSYRRLLLLVGELPSLKAEDLPSFNSTEASWYRIFDLLGWMYLRKDSSAIVNVEERKRGMEILQRCYKVPAIQQLVDPQEREERTDAEYWSRYCDSAEDGQWTINHGHPNHLFLLLRDIPCPSEFSAQEIEVTAQLAKWRSRKVKEPLVWDEVFSSATSLPSDFISSCMETFGNYSITVNRYTESADMHELSLSAARKAVQLAVLRDDLLPHATAPLIRAYEAMQIGHIPLSRRGSPPCLASPFQYGKCLQACSPADHATHESIILLLARRIDPASQENRCPQVKDIITMLWLRPSNAVLRNWDRLEEEEQKGIEIDMKMTLDWVKNANSIPHIVQILRHLATAQKGDPTVGPLWRTTVPGKVNDPHFVEALQTLDRLMGTDCSGDDHHTLINLVCQDLELEPSPDFDGYFTPSRLESLTSLKDPCLKILVGCARGPDFVDSVTVPEAYRKARFNSLARIADCVYKRFSALDSPPTLQLRASLWPMSSALYANALQNAISFDRLQRIFKHTVPCSGCLDGPGHLISHLLNATGLFQVTQNLTLFGKIPLGGRRMATALIIISTLSGGETPSLVRYFPRAKEHVLRKLKEEINEISRSQLHLLVMVWNSVEMLDPQFPEDVGAILAGIQKALQLNYDSRSTFILPLLSQKIRRLRDMMLKWRRGQVEAREAVNEQTDITSHLLLTVFAVSLIYGRQNGRRLFCARPVRDGQAAVGWLTPYEG